jgi:predicted enzyme related to lactoylglutathione lyase
MTLLACSHLVIATDDVPRMVRVFADVFGGRSRFENDMFAEFVLPSRFRVAFFKPTGPSAKTFDAAAPRASVAFGVTVADVDACYQRAAATAGVHLSGPPKTHPWGEKSFLLTDIDGNRWEVTQAPTGDGMLTDRGADE